jgi:hypothetical protein
MIHTSIIVANDKDQFATKLAISLQKLKDEPNVGKVSEPLFSTFVLEPAIWGGAIKPVVQYTAVIIYETT